MLTELKRGEKTTAHLNLRWSLAEVEQIGREIIAKHPLWQIAARHNTSQVEIKAMAVRNGWRVPS